MPRAFSSLQAVGVHAGERLDQRGLAVVDVAGGADDHGAASTVELQLRQLIDELALVLQTAQIEQERAVGDACRSPAPASARNAAASRSSAVPSPRPRLSGASASAALGSSSTGSAPLPIWLWHGTTLTLRRTALPPAPPPAADAPAQRLDVGRRAREQAQRRQALRQPLRLAIEPQHRFERGQRHLVHAQRALQVDCVLIFSIELGAPDDDAGLRPAEQLVAAEGDEIGAVRPASPAASAPSAGRSGSGRPACRCPGPPRTAGRAACASAASSVSGTAAVKPWIA